MGLTVDVSEESLFDSGISLPDKFRVFDYIYYFWYTWTAMYVCIDTDVFREGRNKVGRVYFNFNSIYWKYVEYS